MSDSEGLEPIAPAAPGDSPAETTLEELRAALSEHDRALTSGIAREGVETPAWPALVNRVRLAAVAMETALTEAERAACRWSLLDEGPQVTDEHPLCALIAYCVATDPLHWLDPSVIGEPEFDREWADFVATRLSDLPHPEAWRMVAVVTAAYLAGHSPDAEDVLQLADRAWTASRSMADNNTATPLLTAYDRFTVHYPAPFPQSFRRALPHCSPDDMVRDMATGRPDPSQRDVTEALGLLAGFVTSDTTACLFDINGDCQEHGWVSNPEAPDEQCSTTRARNLLTRLGYELKIPKPVHERQQPASTPDSDRTNPFRTAAVCLELALRPTERGTIAGRLAVNPGIRRLFPVCALLGLGLNHDDALSWTEPVYDSDIASAWNDSIAAAVAHDSSPPQTWLAVSVLGAAYLHGRQPTTEEVLQLASRALERGRPLLDTDEARRLFAAFDDHADLEVPGGLYTQGR